MKKETNTTTKGELLPGELVKEFEMMEVYRNATYIFWQAEENGKPVYNITPIGSYKPTGGYYSKEWILGRKNITVDYFNQRIINHKNKSNETRNKN